MRYAMERRVIRRVLLRFMRSLRQLVRSREAAYYAAHPTARQRCQTCAFAPATNRWVGFEKSANGLMGAIRDERPFLCHANQPGWRTGEFDFAKTRPCMGWAVLADLDPARGGGEFVRATIRGERFPCDDLTKAAFCHAAVTEPSVADLALASVPGAGVEFA